MFKTIDEVWQAVDSGKRVYWTNDLYALTIDPTNNHLTPSYRNGMALRVTCLDNWYGSFLQPQDLPNLYVKG